MTCFTPCCDRIPTIGAQSPLECRSVESSDHATREPFPRVARAPGASITAPPEVICARVNEQRTTDDVLQTDIGDELLLAVALAVGRDVPEVSLVPVLACTPAMCTRGRVVMASRGVAAVAQVSVGVYVAPVCSFAREPAEPENKLRATAYGDKFDVSDDSVRADGADGVPWSLR